MSAVGALRVAAGWLFIPNTSPGGRCVSGVRARRGDLWEMSSVPQLLRWGRDVAVCVT